MCGNGSLAQGEKPSRAQDGVARMYQLILVQFLCFILVPDALSQPKTNNELRVLWIIDSLYGHAILGPRQMLNPFSLVDA